MAARKPAESELSGIEFPEYAPTIFFMEDEPILVKFVSLNRGPENEYGTPFVMTVEGVEGTYANKEGEILAIEKGEHYSVWLLHEVLLNRMREIKPAEGERLAIKKHKKRTNKTGKNEYTPYSVATPDRPETNKANLSWDDIPENDEPGF